MNLAGVKEAILSFHRDERGVIPWLIPAIIGGLGLVQGSQASGRAASATAGQNAAIESLKEILGITKGRQSQFDSILRGLLEQGLFRANSTPYFGGMKGGRAFGALRGGRRPLPAPGMLGAPPAAPGGGTPGGGTLTPPGGSFGGGAGDLIRRLSR